MHRAAIVILGWSVCVGQATLHLPMLGAQMIGTETPLTTIGSSYYERMGVNFGFRLPAATGGVGSHVVGWGGGNQFFPNIQFGQNGMASAIPPFGGYDPGASGRFGFGTIGPGGGGFSLAFDMGKGSSRTVVSSAPSIVVPNGQGGFLFDGEIRPFVTGTIPVVGSQLGESLSPWERERFGLMGSHPALTGAAVRHPSIERAIDETQAAAAAVATDRWNQLSTASQGAPSVASIKAAREAEAAQTRRLIEQHLERVEACVAAADPMGARIELRRAIALETDPHRLRALKARLQQLR